MAQLTGVVSIASIESGGDQKDRQPHRVAGQGRLV